MPLEEVQKLVLERGDEIRRVASSWHTCVDWPWDICAACQQHNNPGPEHYEISGYGHLYLPRCMTGRQIC